MSLFDNIASVATSALSGSNSNVSSLAMSLFNEQGGLSGIVASFEKGGLKNVVQSWVGTGENLSVSASQIEMVMGKERLEKLAAATGIQPETAAAKISEYLPMIVDKLTPNGNLPAGEINSTQIMGALASMIKQ